MKTKWKSEKKTYHNSIKIYLGISIRKCTEKCYIKNYETCLREMKENLAKCSHTISWIEEQRKCCIHAENQSTKNSQGALEKEWRGGRRALLDIKTHYKAEILKACYWHEDRQTDQWNRIEGTLDLWPRWGYKYQGIGQPVQWMVPGQLDGVIEEKWNLVTTSQQSAVDFVRADTGIVVLLLKHGLIY